MTVFLCEYCEYRILGSLIFPFSRGSLGSCPLCQYSENILKWPLNTASSSLEAIWVSDREVTHSPTVSYIKRLLRLLALSTSSNPSVSKK